MTEQETLTKEVSNFDVVEAEIAMLPRVEMPLVHLFTPGIYTRQINIPAGTILTSVKHLTEHPFFVIKGKIDVRSEHECITYEAPCVGVTQPGTRRVLYAHEDTIWITVHANPDNLQTPEEIVEKITSNEKNPLLGEGFVEAWKSSPETFIGSSVALENNQQEGEP